MDYSNIDIQHNSMSMTDLMKNTDKCPFDFRAIVATLGHNVCDIDTIEWDMMPDRQITKISINLIANVKKYNKKH